MTVVFFVDYSVVNSYHFVKVNGYAFTSVHELVLDIRCGHLETEERRSEFMYCPIIERTVPV
jgi:hypothetical protein